MARFDPTRRVIIRTGLLMPAALGLAGVLDRRVQAEPAQLTPTPSCEETGSTPSQTEGPFFKPNSPLRTSLIEAGIDGERLVLEGRVLSTRCEPIAGAVVDLWHADARGRYDNDGFRLRGYQNTDTQGRFRFETIVPGSYAVRTRHYHVKVKPLNGPLLTTQLYFPGEPGNRLDFLFRPELLMEVADGGQSKQGRYDFVLALG